MPKAARVLAEYFYDDESRHWGFVVPSLNIVGGGLESREDAEREARDAILFTLEDDDREPVPSGHEIGYFHVSIEQAS